MNSTVTWHWERVLKRCGISWSVPASVPNTRETRLPFAGLAKRNKLDEEVIVNVRTFKVG
jgi:hypothetical protein